MASDFEVCLDEASGSIASSTFQLTSVLMQPLQDQQLILCRV
jgi:hypothetical protein